MVRSNLLNLPNELLIDVFKYFDTNQLFHSFHGLNTRLNNLVKEYHNGQLVLDTNQNFNFLFQYLKPEEIYSLTLPSSNQMVLFEKLFANKTFVKNCRALIVFDIEPWDFIDLVPRLPQFKSLLSLVIIRKTDICYTDIYQQIFDIIGSNKMPSLKYLKLISQDQMLFIRPISLSAASIQNNLEYLTLERCKIIDLLNLYDYLPNLKKVYVHSLEVNERPSNSSQTKTKATNLKIEIKQWSSETFDNLAVLLAQMPELKILSIKAFGKNVPSGQKWEHLIQRNIPHLKKFRFEFRMRDIADFNMIWSTFETVFSLNTTEWSGKCKQIHDRQRHTLICQCMRS